jgi:protein tyrosine/serine phosphatase
MRPGALVRSDSLCRLTAAGQAALVAYGVRTVIDLRAREEAARASYALTAEGTPESQPLYRNVPIFDEADAETIAALDAQPGIFGINKVLFERCGPGFAAALRTIGDAPAGGVLVHCYHGKDRTGLVVALTLAVAGVPPEPIVADYGLSDHYLQPIYAEQLAACDGNAVAVARLKALLTSYPATMRDTLTYLDITFGGPEAYLRGIGLTPEELAALRRRMVA